MTSSPIESARSRHDLSTVAARTGIATAGSGSVTVRCPFPSHGHYDRSPSLRLYLDDAFFYCFGCGTKGDVVEWVSQTESVGWRDAIGILDAGGPLANAWGTGGAGLQRGRCPRPDDGRPAAAWPDPARTPAERVLEALALGWRLYTSPDLHDRGVNYLAGRGIIVALLEDFTGRQEIGHTPSDASKLVTHMQAQGFMTEELIDAGLAVLGADGRLRDFYRQRVLVPVRDTEGRVVGIVGRNVGDERWPKYKNPPRTVAYDKSINLYQPLPAPAAGTLGRVVVVEGTIDAMAIAVAAIEAGRGSAICPVTQSGRELSPAQFDYVLSLTPHSPVIGFDGDSAGRESTARLVSSAAKRGIDVLVTTLPEGHDPASWLADRGPAGLGAWTPDQRLDNERVTAECETAKLDVGRAGRTERADGRTCRPATGCPPARDAGILSYPDSLVPAL